VIGPPLEQDRAVRGAYQDAGGDDEQATAADRPAHLGDVPHAPTMAKVDPDVDPGRLLSN
jgi:hypothetical protein